jgi:hypothetical protein
MKKLKFNMAEAEVQSEGHFRYARESIHRTLGSGCAVEAKIIMGVY